MLLPHTFYTIIMIATTDDSDFKCWICIKANYPSFFRKWLLKYWKCGAFTIKCVPKVTRMHCWIALPSEWRAVNRIASPCTIIIKNLEFSGNLLHSTIVDRLKIAKMTWRPFKCSNELHLRRQKYCLAHKMSTITCLCESQLLYTFWNLQFTQPVHSICSKVLPIYYL